MKQGYNDNWLAFQELCYRKAVVAYRLRMCVFAGSLALVLLLVWLACCWAWEPFCAYQAREQAELDAEYEGLEAAYHAEALYGLERSTMYNVQGTMEEGDGE